MYAMPALSTEAINYQNTQVFKELELAFRNMMTQTKSEFMEQKRENEKLLEAIVRNSFNANCSVDIGNYYPSMRVYDEYHNSTLIRNDYREFFAAEYSFTKRFMKDGAQKGAVNMNTAKLSGVFTELPFLIHMPISHIQSGYRGGYGEYETPPAKLRFTSEELAAIFLHEVGHFFTYCEMFSRTVTTNQALSAMSKALDDSYSVDQRVVVIGKCVADLNLQDIDVKALAATDKKSIIETSIVYETVEKSRTELGISIYDSTASEFLADQFANRHGCGRHLMTGLNKFVGLFGGENAHQSMPLFMFSQLVSIVLNFIPPFTFILVPMNVLLICLGGVGDDGDNTYDTPEIRFRRIKQDTLARLKNRTISNDEKKTILADLAAMEKAMEGIKDKREWREYIATTIIPVYRRHRKTKMLQQQLEQLANNPLFVRAAELTTL